MKCSLFTQTQNKNRPEEGLFYLLTHTFLNDNLKLERIFKHIMNISVDLGDTVFDRKAKQKRIDGTFMRKMFPGSYSVLEDVVVRGHQLFIISKIDAGEESRILAVLEQHNIIPDLLNQTNVYFCYEREAKAPIARRLHIDVHIDDRVQVMNALNGIVPHKLFFLEGHDDRNPENELCTEVIEVHNWPEVQQSLQHLPNW